MRPWEGRRMSSVQAFYLEDRTSFVFGAWHVFGAVDWKYGLKTRKKNRSSMTDLTISEPEK